MKRLAAIFIIVCLCLGPQFSFAQRMSYDYLIQLGLESLKEAKYQEAIIFFQMAAQVDPQKKDAEFYINLAKRAKEGRLVVDQGAIDSTAREVVVEQADLVKIDQAQDDLALREKEINQLLDNLEQSRGGSESLVTVNAYQKELDIVKAKLKNVQEEFAKNKLLADSAVTAAPLAASTFEISIVEPKVTAVSDQESYYEQELNASLNKLKNMREELAAIKQRAQTAKVAEPVLVEPVSAVKRADSIKNSLVAMEAQLGKTGVLAKKDTAVVSKTTKTQATTKPLAKEITEEISEESQLKTKTVTTVVLNEENKVNFPMNIKLLPREALTIEAANIKRFIAIEPKVVKFEQTNPGQLKIIGQDLGISVVHVWDDLGRWTFVVRVVALKDYHPPQEKFWEEMPGFRFRYDYNWRSYYWGPSFNELGRQNYSYTQWTGLEGPTPYGILDASCGWDKLGDFATIYDYTVGLSRGHFMSFDGFNLRAFNYDLSFSPLTLPGMALYGAKFGSPLFRQRFYYTVFYGEEEGYYYSPITVELPEKSKSATEGMRIEYLGDYKNKYYANYVQGRGLGRADYLKDQVYSLQSEHNWDDLRFNTEAASDSERVAYTVSGQLHKTKVNYQAGLRNIDKDYMTISGHPAGKGELGGFFSVDWLVNEKLSTYANLDVYRDRYLYNPNDPRAANYYSNSSLNYIIDDSSNVGLTVNYSYTPGLISPGRNFSCNTNYGRRFILDFLGKRAFGTHFGYGYQRSSSLLAYNSDYENHTVSSGFNLELTRFLNYFFNYNYSYLKELESSATFNPTSIDTGLQANYRFGSFIGCGLSVIYRQEKRTSSVYSYLAGEDSLQGSLNVTVTPNRDVSFFVDGNLRKVWPDDLTRSGYLDAGVRFGARLEWDSFIRWSATTLVKGQVFKDLNSNGIKDKGESGVSGVKIIVGAKEVTTDSQGYYQTKIKAYSAIASVDASTLPEGYILTNSSSVNVDAKYGGKKEINFGINTQSGVYGIIYLDVNNNLKLDRADKPLSGVEIKLDNRLSSYSNTEGIYYFNDVYSGKHELTININSLPKGSLPKVEVRKQIDIEQGLTYTYHIPISDQ